MRVPLLVVALSAWSARAAAQPLPEVGWTEERGGFRAIVHPDGSLEFEDAPPSPAMYVLGYPIFAGAAGLTSGQFLVVSFGLGAVERQVTAHSPDRHFLEKRAIMLETFEARAAMRGRWNARVMQEALAALPSYLQAIWREPGPRARRILFELWDECAEEGNLLVSSGGATARRMIEAFIQERLPPGSLHAYRPAELARFNRARASRARFDPYGRGPAAAMAAPALPVTVTPACSGAPGVPAICDQ